jgi:cytochrome d ubiquinol oxidase subunit II
MVADVVGGILLAGITLYAVLGGADFGAGLWDLVACGEVRGLAPRQLIDESITPVWEANHVWLVFDLVIFWTAFPHAFSAVMTAVALPLWLAAGGIVLRGSGFAFRKEVSRPGLVRLMGAFFAFSSLVTPFFMGTVIGAIATGSVPPNGNHANLAAWTSTTSVLAGLLFVAVCGYLAAVYLTGEAERREDSSLRVYFGRRARVAAVVAGALSLGLLAALHSSNRLLYDRLTGRALPLVIVAGVFGLAVFMLMLTDWVRARELRLIAAAGVTAVIWGWGVAQYPTLLPGSDVTLSNAGAPDSTMAALIVVFIVAVALIGPSFVLLFRLQSRRMLQSEEGNLSPPSESV